MLINVFIICLFLWISFFGYIAITKDKISTKTMVKSSFITLALISILYAIIIYGNA